MMEQRSLLGLLDEIQAIGRTGLAFATRPHDRASYQRLVELAAEYYGAVLELPPAEVRRRWGREFGQVTPKVGAEAVLFDAADRVFLLRRADDGCWGVPGGWLEPNESPEECAVRETREETGFEVRPLRTVGVFTRKAADGEAPQSSVAVVYLCELVGGTLRLSPESTDAGWFAPGEVRDWHGWHREHVEAASRAR